MIFLLFLCGKIEKMKQFLSLLLALSAVALPAQNTETLQEKAARMAWWKDAKFGLFIHWGIYAVAAGEYGGQTNYGEWLMNEAKIPVPEYEKLAAQFNPTGFDAEAWVTMAKNAGMKYIVITSKHHDGFSMFDSGVSDYDIIDRTPFRRDPMRELADACRKHGLKLCFYHSIMDWHHPQANKAGFARYRDEYMKPQLRELLTRYGDIGVLWFDGEWIDEWTEEQGKALYRYVRELQPGIIVNNRVGKGRNGMQGMNNTDDAAGDFGTPEQEILGEKSALDWESCMTMNDHWGYNKHDKNFKSAEDLIWNLADITAKGGNFLLNIGPTAEGRFPDECVERLQTIGNWTAINHEAVYGAKTWTHWQEGESLRYALGADGDISVFFRNVPGRELLLKKVRPDNGSSIRLPGCQQTPEWRQTPEGVVITLPPDELLPYPGQKGMTRVLRIKGKPEAVTAPPRIGEKQDAGRKNAVFAGTTEVGIEAEPGATVFYTLDGGEPTETSKRYDGKIKLAESATIRAIARKPGLRSSETVQLRFEKARYGLNLESVYAGKYAAQGPLSLVDGVHGSTVFTDGNWLGFEGGDLLATLDLGRRQAVQAVEVSFLRVIPSWIFLPQQVEVSGSVDGKTFVQLARRTLPAAANSDANAVETVALPATGQYRYLRVKASGQGICPPWHAGAGSKAWLFVDEIRVVQD